MPGKLSAKWRIKIVQTLKELIDTLPQTGVVEWMAVRPARKEPMISVQTLEGSPEHGLQGDRYSGSTGIRQVTLVQAEHLSVLESILGRSVSPEVLRRNIVVRGINLLALKNRDITVGSVVLSVTGLCHPCSRMETELGAGGYNAMRGHGGITARIVTSGCMNLGDNVRVVPSDNIEV